MAKNLNGRKIETCQECSSVNWPSCADKSPQNGRCPLDDWQEPEANSDQERIAALEAELAEIKEKQAKREQALAGMIFQYQGDAPAPGPYDITVGGVKVGEVPEPDGVECSPKCPFREIFPEIGMRKNCGAGLANEGYYFPSPGPGCPRHKEEGNEQG